eukprot:m.40270 g.40270  ORF g.40270 m.40270 type:complete len:158 (-) comp10338_c0_seq3:80-553(-)
MNPIRLCLFGLFITTLSPLCWFAQQVLAAKYSVLLMIFLHHVTQSRSVKREKLRRSTKKIPTPIFDKFVREFLGGKNVDEDSTMYNLSKRGKDLLMMYIIVTVCHATNYIISSEELASEMKVTQSHLVKLARTLHCGTRTVDKKQHLVIKLWKKHEE